MVNPEPEKFTVKTTKPFKLKDNPSNRGGMMFDLKEAFGFSPARIIIQKVRGKNNELVLAAVVEKDPLLVKCENEVKNEKIIGKGVKQK